LADDNTKYLNSITLVILAGGEGSRMGIPKGMLKIKARPILSHILANANWPGPTLLVTSPSRQSPPGAEEFDAEAVDPVAGLGPMRGVLTALENAQTEAVIVCAVDMPAMNGEVFRWIAEQLIRKPAAHGILIERILNGKVQIEPLPAAFRRSARQLLVQRIASGKRSLCGLAVSDAIEVVQAPQHWTTFWENLNYPHDLSRWEN
jgi:molybdopterin-guanine dinucleotide biosynthesis protein A